VVHLHNFSRYVPIVRALNPRSKIVLHMHCEWLTQFDRRLIGRRLRHVDLIVGCSDHITEKIRRTFPEYADRCVTVYNGVDPERFNGRGCPRGGGERQVLFVGRISPEKGIHDLLDAFASVAAVDPTVRLTVVGRPGSAPPEFLVSLSDDPNVRDLHRFYASGNGAPGDPYFSHLKEMLTPETADRVTFTGHVAYEHVIDYYRRADLVVNPSLSEAFGMSLVEAMVAEIPVVATKVGGMVEIVEEGATGLLVEPGEPARLAEAMRHLLERADVRRQMGTAGRRRALTHFSWERVVERLALQYERFWCAASEVPHHSNAR
jgi:glycosyltransferase involved in cell wall biosynthesis